jgi:hypothetical protein
VAKTRAVTLEAQLDTCVSQLKSIHGSRSDDRRIIRSMGNAHLPLARNGENQAKFSCLSCRRQDHADINAAVDILKAEHGRRRVKGQPMARENSRRPNRLENPRPSSGGRC